MSSEKNEAVVLKAATRWRKKEGILVLTNQRLLWMIVDAKEPEVSIPFDQMKAQFVNQPSQTGRIMLKITLINLILNFFLCSHLIRNKH